MPNMTTVFADAVARSTASASAGLTPAGFSHSTCFPASIAASTISR
jgi:hypothetical protein